MSHRQAHARAAHDLFVTFNIPNLGALPAQEKFAELLASEVQDIALGVIGLVQDQAQELSRFAPLVLHDLVRPALIRRVLHRFCRRKLGRCALRHRRPIQRSLRRAPWRVPAVVRRQRQGRSGRHLVRRAALIHGIQQVRTADDNRHASGPDSNFSSQGKPNMSNLDISDSGRSVM